MQKQITVKELIVKLLDCEMDGYILIRDEKGKELHNVSINVNENSGIGCLFG